MKTNRFLLLVIAGIIIVSLSNCSKDTEDPPAIPGENSVFMDFSFTTMKKSLLISDDTSNFRLAKSLVAFWEVKANLYNTIPRAAFKKALSVSPTFVSNYNSTKKWSWSFNFMVGSTEYLGELNSIAIDTATVTKDSVTWTLFISQVGTSDAYKYLEGKSAVDNTGGWWKLYYIVGEERVPFIKIDWTKEYDKLTSLKYTNIITSDSNKGSYIEYNSVVSSTFDRSFIMNIISYPNNASLNNLPILIKWNSTNKNGQIIVNSTPWGCWNTNYINTTCTN